MSEAEAPTFDPIVVLVDSINLCLGCELDIGAPTTEPSIWDMIRHYYTSNGIDPATSRRHTDKVCDLFVAEIVDRNLAPTRPTGAA